MTPDFVLRLGALQLGDGAPIKASPTHKDNQANALKDLARHVKPMSNKANQSPKHGQATNHGFAEYSNTQTQSGEIPRLPG